MAAKRKTGDGVEKGYTVHGTVRQLLRWASGGSLASAVAVPTHPRCQNHLDRPRHRTPNATWETILRDGEQALGCRVCAVSARAVCVCVVCVVAFACLSTCNMRGRRGPAQAWQSRFMHHPEVRMTMSSLSAPLLQVSQSPRTMPSSSQPSQSRLAGARPPSLVPCLIICLGLRPASFLSSFCCRYRLSLAPSTPPTFFLPSPLPVLELLDSKDKGVIVNWR